MVQRYDPEVEGEPGCEVAIMLPMSQPDDVYATPDYPGEYVKHADYAARIAELEAERDATRKQTPELVEAVEEAERLRTNDTATAFDVCDAVAIAAIKASQLKEQDDE